MPAGNFAGHLSRASKYAVLLLVSLIVIQWQPRPLNAGLFTRPAVRKIEKIIDSPELSGTNVGVKVVSIATGKTLFERNAGKLFVPASNVKLLTAYAALKLLTPQYTFMTEFAADAAVSSGTVNTLYIRGRGDPSLTFADIALQAQAVSGTVKRVTGDIVIDNSYFDPLLFGRGWMWDEGPAAWNAPLSPYGINGNCVDIYVRPSSVPGGPAQARLVPETAYAVVVSSAATLDAENITVFRETGGSVDRFIVTGSIPYGAPERRWRCAVSRPGLYAGTLFRELLARNGVTVGGTVREGAAPGNAVVVARYASRPLADIVRYFLKESDNFTGECILKTLGAGDGTRPGDAAAGIARVREVLSRAGISEKNYTMADGSGMSRYNLASPDTMVQVLRAACRDFSIAPEFMNALSVAGVDGTLKDRLKDSAAGGFRAKTGTLEGVSAVAGYLQTRKGTLLAVSLIMNGYTGSSAPLKAAQDEILRVLWDKF